MIVFTVNAPAKKVCFAEEEAVHYVEKLDREECEKLFYQGADFIQFRADFNQFRAMQQRRDVQLLRFNAMSRQVRAEMQASNQPKLVAAPLPTPLMSKPERRRTAAPRGCAGIA